MKIVLPFNLLPHLDDTGIAACFGLKNQPSDGHTVIELSSHEAHDLLKLLRALENELHSRQKRLQRTASRSPLGMQKSPGIENRLSAIRHAGDAISGKLGVFMNGRMGKEAPP